MSDSDDDGSVPPDAQGEAVGVDDLPQAAGANAAPQHPVWAAAAGRGGGAANKGRSDNVYGPISMMELEIRGRGDLDGGSSTASVRGGDAKKKDAHSRQSKKAKKGKRPREYDDDDDSDDSDNEAGSSASLDMAGAAFGGATTKNRAACASEASDDGVSVTSSVVRRRHERAFPITGVTCVGCALPAKIQPVTEFISKNMSTMSELALYKMAALVYKTKVAEPAEEEGVDVPVGRPLKNCNSTHTRALTLLLTLVPRMPQAWDWKEVRAHFQLHTVDSRMQRYENIRTLSAMRKTLEMQLLRRDAETGEQTLDKNNAESIMKIIAASSRELTLLADASTTKKRG